MKFRKLIKQIKFHFVLLSLNGLRNQKRNGEPQTRSQKFAAVNNSKFLNSCKSMWTGGSYRQMKLKSIDQRNTNRKRIRHIDREYSRETSICAKCVQPSVAAAQKHELTIQPDRRDKSTLSQFHSFWWRLSGVSEWVWNQTSGREDNCCLHLQSEKYELEMKAATTSRAIISFSQTTLLKIL